jgi:hypothetical protein
MGKRLLLLLWVAAVVTMALTVGAEAAEMKASDPLGYVGSEACRKCHTADFDSWKESFHSKMVRKRDEGILKDVVEKWATDGENPGPATANVTGRKISILDVEYVVGSNWKQRFLVRDEFTSGYQFANKQFNRMSGKWENYGQKNDWDTMCATCHTTGYRVVQYDPANPKTQKVAWSELSVGCENCHGPGAKHVKSRSKKDIWNFTGKPKAEQSRVCGYCHIRLENELYKSAQGNPREDFPAPKVGQSFKPSDDWTKWYPAHVVIPGVQPEDKIDAEYKGDLKGMFLLDNVSKAAGVYEAGKHHEEYQEMIQSKHHKSGELSCITCHSPHAGKKMEKKDAKASCAKCHDASHTVEKYMPGTGKTADNLYLRTHTFYKGQSRPGGPTVSGTPEYYFKK